MGAIINSGPEPYAIQILNFTTTFADFGSAFKSIPYLILLPTLAYACAFIGGLLLFNLFNLIAKAFGGTIVYYRLK